MVLYGKSSQEYPVNAGVPQVSILVLHFSYYTLMTFLMLSVILPSILMILYSKFDQTSDLWQQLELVSELDSDLLDTGLGQEVAC